VGLEPVVFIQNAECIAERKGKSRIRSRSTSRFHLVCPLSVLKFVLERSC
jgi:hypothetical protein